MIPKNTSNPRSEWNLGNPVLEEKLVKRKRQGGTGVPPVLTLISVSKEGAIFFVGDVRMIEVASRCANAGASPSIRVNPVSPWFNKFLFH